MPQEVLEELTRRPSVPTVDLEKRRVVRVHLVLGVLVLVGLEQRELLRPKQDEQGGTRGI